MGYTVRRHNKTQHGVILDIKDIHPIPTDQQKPTQKRGYTWSREKSHPMLRELTESKKVKFEGTPREDYKYTCTDIRTSETHQEQPQVPSFFPGFFMPQNARNFT